MAAVAAADAASGGGQRSSILTPILGAMLGDGPIRMITLGQELTVDMDEKTLAEMQFKELQVICLFCSEYVQPVFCCLATGCQVIQNER